MLYTELGKVDFNRIDICTAMDLPPCGEWDEPVVVHVGGRPQRWNSREACARFYGALAANRSGDEVAWGYRAVAASCRGGATMPTDGAPLKAGADGGVEYRVSRGRAYRATVSNGGGTFHGSVSVGRETVPADIFGVRVFLCDVEIDTGGPRTVRLYRNVEFFAEPPPPSLGEPFPSPDGRRLRSEVLRNADAEDFTARAYACDKN